MPWFVKTEVFTKDTLNLSNKERQKFIKEHKKWIKYLTSSGEIIYSGYLVDENKCPGGGGLLIIKSNSYNEAKILISSDPMITNNLVIWKLNEWIPIDQEINI